MGVRYSGPKILNDKMERELIDAYSNTDEPIKSIAKRFGVSQANVSRCAKRYGIPFRKPKASFWSE